MIAESIHEPKCSLQIVLENNGVEKLVDMSRSPDPSLRLNSIWALKNLLYQADSVTKDLVMKKLTYSGLQRFFLFFFCFYLFSCCIFGTHPNPIFDFSLLNDPEPGIQEQALNLLRNLACSKDAEAAVDIENIFQGIGDQLIPILESKLESSQQDTIQQSIFVLVNLATGRESHKERIISSERLLARILHFMASVFSNQVLSSG